MLEIFYATGFMLLILTAWAVAGIISEIWGCFK